MAQRFVQHSFNNPFKEVIKDDGNVEKQKKGEKNYTSETESTINITVIVPV